MLNVEMLSTGDEVLHGQIVDTNAAWLADFFFNQGLPLTRRNTVGDNLNDLVSVLRERSEHADILIVNGGLGPTSDDLSALAAATAKGEGLVLHEAWLTEMERYFRDRGRVMAPSNRKQAELPASAEFINNPVGTACGFALKLNRCLMFLHRVYRQNSKSWLSMRFCRVCVSVSLWLSPVMPAINHLWPF